MIYTDNNLLTSVFTSAKLNAIGLQWTGELSDFELQIKYRTGKANTVVDTMFRLPSHMEQNMQSCSETVSMDEIQATIAEINAIHKGDTSWANAVVPITFQLSEQEQAVGLSCSQIPTDGIAANHILDAQVYDQNISKVLPYVKKKEKTLGSQLHTKGTEVR